MCLVSFHYRNRRRWAAVAAVAASGAAAAYYVYDRYSEPRTDGYVTYASASHKAGMYADGVS